MTDEMLKIGMLARRSYMYRFGSTYSESVKIDAVGDLGMNECYFQGVGEDSGIPYTVWYSEVDLSKDKFYKLMEVDYESSSVS